jgi:hypothetical protein
MMSVTLHMKLHILAEIDKRTVVKVNLNHCTDSAP